MPTQYVTLEETNRTILTACFNDIVKEVVYKLGIPMSTVVTVHNGVDITKTDNRTDNVSLPERNNVPSTIAQRRLVAVITDNYNEDSLSSTTVSQPDTTPIFNDHEIDCIVYPVYVKTDININFEYISPSKTEALRLRDDIRVKLSDSRNIIQHEVTYDIILPEIICDFIADIHDLKSRLIPADLSDYFNVWSTKRMRMVTDMVNPGNSRLAIKERQVRIIGIMDFSPEPEPIEQDKDTNTYKLTIPYKLSLDIPRGMCFRYPPMICNKLMPSKYLQFVVDRKTRIAQFKDLGYTHSLGALSNLETNRIMTNTTDIVLPKNIPLFDEFSVRKGHPGYVTLYTFLTDVDETDKRTLLNLRELGDFYMDERLLAFIRDVDRGLVINPYMSYFYLSLYQTSRYTDNNILEILPDLTVRSKVALSLVKPVRVALSICLDTTYLNPTVQPRMYSHPEIYLLYLSELMTGIRNYRQEFSEMSVAYGTFYRNFVLMLDRAIKRDDYAFLVSFMEIVSREIVITQHLVGLLRNTYPRIYAIMSTVYDMEKLKYTDAFKRDDVGAERYAMKTSMIYSLEASLNGR